MQILIYGHGSARDHATFVRLKKESSEKIIYFALSGPNALLEEEDGVFRVNDAEEAAKEANRLKVELVLMLGYSEKLIEDIEIFKRSACPVLEIDESIFKLEASKKYSKEMMRSWGVPTPEQWCFKDSVSAVSFIKQNWEKLAGEIVVKADAMLDNPGHRATTPDTIDSAIVAVETLAKFYPQDILIERRVFGTELSLHLLFDGNSYVLLPPVQDYKRLLFGDRGPNTAGIGSVASTFKEDIAILEGLEEKIIIPTLSGMQMLSNKLQMILYIGVILTDTGPMVLEYNIRSGSPEWLALLPLIKSPLTDLFKHLRDKTLAKAEISFREDFCSTATAIVARGYPNEPFLGPMPITYNPDVLKDVEIYGENLYLKDGRLMAETGRVAMVVSSGESWSEVRERSLKGISQINFPGMYYREDIGISGLKLYA
ncbi:MAG: hypothetical protein KBC84_05410 [Proteobacteria bacterium]|nr:hypothetical protein [Pseudomonadota bacterium]